MKKLILGGQSLLIGRGSLEKVKDIAATKAFIVTGGSSMVKSGVVDRIAALLQENNCSAYIYSGIPKNPDSEDVLAGVAKMREVSPDLLIAVGGGSAIDAAKVMGLLFEYPEITFDNILGPLPTERKKIKLVAIPSTSGTGSEVTTAAVITFHERNLKIGLISPAFLPDIAILDAELTMTMPDNVVAETGMDAVTHAVESYTNRNLDDFTEPMARGAVAGLFKNLPLSYREKTLDSREKVHHYQAMAGIVFINVGLGMCHGIAHAVGGQFDLGHGLINAIALPYVLDFNVRDEWVGGQLRQLASSIGCVDFIAAVRELNEQLTIPTSFRQAGVSEADFYKGLSQLTDNSLKGTTRTNPIAISHGEMTEILERIYRGQ